MKKYKKCIDLSYGKQYSLNESLYFSVRVRFFVHGRADRTACDSEPKAQGARS